MARMTKNGVSGLVGTVVLYSVNGKEYMRSKPSGVKKRKNNPINVLFRDVTRNGTPLVSCLKSYGDLHFPFGLHAYNAVRGWIRNVQASNASSPELAVRPNSIANLNAAADLRDFIAINFTAQNAGNIITVTIPALKPVKDIKSPPKTGSMQVKIIAVSSPYQEPCAKEYKMESFVVENTAQDIPAREIILTTNAKPGDMAMIVIALEFNPTNGNGYLREPKWLPAAAIAMGRLG